MNCTRCGMDAVMIDNLWYCAACFKLFNECTCSKPT